MISIRGNNAACAKFDGITITEFGNDFMSVYAQLFIPITSIRSVTLINSRTFAFCCFGSLTTSPHTLHIQSFEWDIPEQKEYPTRRERTLKGRKTTVQLNDEVVSLHYANGKLFALTRNTLVVFRLNEDNVIKDHQYESTDPRCFDFEATEERIYFSLAKSKTINFFVDNNRCSFPFFITDPVLFVKIASGIAIVGLGRQALVHCTMMHKSTVSLQFDDEYTECMFMLCNNNHYIIGLQNKYHAKVFMFNTYPSKKQVKASLQVELTSSQLPCAARMIRINNTDTLAIITPADVLFYTPELSFITKKVVHTGNL